MHRMLALLPALLLAAADAQGAAYPLDGRDVVGFTTFRTLAYEDTFAKIAEHSGIGYQELLDANPGVDPWLPGAGTRIELPTRYILPAGAADGIVINIAEYRLYLFLEGRVVTFPVGIGRGEFRTPVGVSRVVAHLENPSWTPTPAARAEHRENGDVLPTVVPPGPDNPLGRFALRLSLPGYYIHGTNKPFGVGQMVSMGCVRLYPRHIETLVELAPNGMAVRVVYEPMKLARHEGGAYAEIHTGPYENPSAEELAAHANAWARTHGVRLDASALHKALAERSGVPVRIGEQH